MIIRKKLICLSTVELLVSLRRTVSRAQEFIEISAGFPVLNLHPGQGKLHEANSKMVTRKPCPFHSERFGSITQVKRNSAEVLAESHRRI